MRQYTTDATPIPCPCRADRHVPTGGCPEDAFLHPEGDDPMPCGNCAPFESINRHLEDHPPAGYGARYSRAEVDEAMADRELMADEFAGWAPGELVEAFGK